VTQEIFVSTIDKLEKLNETLIHKIEWIGFAALIMMMVITCLDVIGAKVFLNPIHGALDSVEIAQLVAISFAAGAALIHGRHIEVEFFVVLLPKRVQAGIAFFIQLLGVALFAAIVWRLAQHAYYFQAGGEVSPTARIPLFPFTYGAALACIPVFIVLLLEAIKSFFRVVRR
jgi:TRAP-type C4-dicarboxylate transport system permease small subunit